MWTDEARKAAIEARKAAIADRTEGYAGLINTAGLPEKGRDLVHTHAENFAKRMRDSGFEANLRHSGSLFGPSSYVEINDPETGRYIKKPIRFSGHQNGVFNSAGVIDAADKKTQDKIHQQALDMRALGPAEGMKNSNSKLEEERIRAKIAKSEARKVKQQEKKKQTMEEFVDMREKQKTQK